MKIENVEGFLHKIENIKLNYVLFTEWHEYVEGFCFLRNKKRCFRLDRIQNIEETKPQNRTQISTLYRRTLLFRRILLSATR